MSQTKMTTGKVRFSYANVFVPTSMEEGQTKKYNVSLLIPKSDTKTVAKLKAAIQAAHEEGKDKYGVKYPKALKSPMKDGDVDKEGDEVYEGHYYISAKSLTKPPIFDADREKLMDNDEFYSGCYGRASINFYPYILGSKGIACGLNGLQKLEDGPKLGGGGCSADDFGDDENSLM